MKSRLPGRAISGLQRATSLSHRGVAPRRDLELQEMTLNQGSRTSERVDHGRIYCFTPLTPVGQLGLEARRWPMALALVLFCAVMISACGGSETVSSSTEQGIVGRYVFTGPGVQIDCSQLPSEEVSACEETNRPWTRPFANADIEIRDSEDRSVTTTTSDGDGNFRVLLPPGEYLLCAAGCEGPVEVHEGSFTAYTIAIAAP
jgi:hypothetical protein